MLPPNSPLFAPAQLTEADRDPHVFLPTLPEKPLASTNSIQIYVIPTEKTIFLEGFKEEEYGDRPPTILRGCLYIRVLKPTKIKLITLAFKGIQKTEWPEGIPPKKNTFTETNDIILHVWPFFTLGLSTPNNGADHFQELPHCLGGPDFDRGRDELRSILPMPMRHTDMSLLQLEAPATSMAGISDFFARTISLSPAAGVLRRARSPSTSSTNRQNLPRSSSVTDLNLVISNTMQSEDKDLNQFAPGDYIYNFEHPIQPSAQESCHVTFGEVNYYLEATVLKPSTFNKKVSGKYPVNIVRILSDDNLEENEPIVISRDWEDQLQYDIVVGSKSVILDSYVPISFKFVPLWGKVALHRIRIYLTENMEYFCNNKKVHRMEPTRKFLLLEHKALKGKSLLLKLGGNDESTTEEEEFSEVIPRELQFQVYVPHVVNPKFNMVIHPDTSLQNIQVHHWIKICLRISRKDPDNPEKRKHYEILIDSPIRILLEQCVHANTLLPVYDQNLEHPADAPLPLYTPPHSPGVIPVDGDLQGNYSLDAMMTEPQFSQLSTTISREMPLQREDSQHLDSNLFKPPDNHEELTKSPQAVPMDSPTLSPVRYQEPGAEPPSFAEARMVSPPLLSVLPPEYTEEEFSARGRNRAPIQQLLLQQLLSLILHSLKRDRHASARLSILQQTSSGQLTSGLSSTLALTQTDTTAPETSNSLVPDSLSESLSSELAIKEQDEQDIVDTYAPNAESPASQEPGLSPHLGALHSNQSRKSSVSSINSFHRESEASPLESIPLLAQSQTSLEYVKSRGDSVISLLLKGFGENEDLYHVNRNLQQLRNPRIKKHYQEESSDLDEQTDRGDAGRHHSVDMVPHKQRQKSFGVVQAQRQTPSSEFVMEEKIGKVPKDPVDGLNLGYAIE